MEAFIFLFLGLVLGGTLVYLWQRNAGKSIKVALEKSIADLQRDKAVIESEKNAFEKSITELREKIRRDEIEKMDMGRTIAGLESDIKNWREKLVQHQAEFEKNQKQLTEQFENLANKILEEKTEKFTVSNKRNMDSILNPLKEKITLFEEKVSKSYDAEAKERHTLKAEIVKLMELNSNLNEEAQKLTRALKGDRKKQGNWGEIILDKILESSGLKEGREYETQYSTSDESNARLYPDVVVKLPDNKHIIIDSKVSLVAYERLVNAENEVDRKLAIHEHIISVKNHIKQLSDKDYFKAKGIKSPDFVLMFMPIESSFGAAIEADSDVFNFAWDRRIVIVSPSTLLATLKTVASLWRQEKQNINAAKIATDAGNLYDKFVLLLGDLEKLGSQLKTVQSTFDGTMTKLKDGRGNLITRVEKLRKLGAKASKQIDIDWVEAAEED
ncbi:MAG: DNA recombination protein RmuC [Cryomorphaceae bacterium]|nr:DNA recombination protein RmuC [Cryomorphaceae bacterium]